MESSEEEIQKPEHQPGECELKGLKVNGSGAIRSVAVTHMRTGADRPQGKRDW